ncbi:EcsC family protein [Paenibacillus hamazuiensis]|uniref:EcsC family protein n=1 Tax=Paenibacillus hamazuiensis TaxID=2936508 RepID=UPI00200BCFD2|nr:EcsC family protein [Paenibacillus hamazuiensis]
MDRFRTYEDKIRLELKQWENKLLQPPGFVERTSRLVQGKINQVIPEKVHEAITAAVKGIVKTALFSLDYIPKGEPLEGISLAERDRRASELLSVYKKLAAAEGAGTGAGGILLGLADFPLLIGIKMKFLFELAHVYGFRTKDYRERLFLLYVFQLAFSGQTKKPALLQTILRWPETAASLPPLQSNVEHIDWQQLQQEYRDTIDFRKMLQLVPGIGAVVGAWANYGLLEELGETGINCFRLRLLNGPQPEPLEGPEAE